MELLWISDEWFPNPCDGCDKPLFLRGDDEGSLTDADEGGRELKREVLLLLLLLMLLEILDVVNDVDELNPEYGDDDRLVLFLFIAEEIRLPMELIFLAFSSMDSSVKELFVERLSILIEEDGESAFVTEFVFWRALEKELLLPLERMRSLNTLSVSPQFLKESLTTDLVLFDDADDNDEVLRDADANVLVKSAVLLLSYLWYGLL